MSLNKQVLLDFLEELDKELERKITVVAVGGTAMTLHNAKESTIDVDFTIPVEDYTEFHRVLDLVPLGSKSTRGIMEWCSAKTYLMTIWQKANQ